MKVFGLIELKRLLIIALLGISFVLSIAAAAIAAPFPASQALIAQTTEAIPPESSQPSRTSPLTREVEDTAKPEQPATEQPSTQDNQRQPSTETTSSRERSRSDRASTQAPYDPYDMGAIRQFDNSWYGQ